MVRSLLDNDSSDLSISGGVPPEIIRFTGNLNIRNSLWFLPLPRTSAALAEAVVLCHTHLASSLMPLTFRYALHAFLPSIFLGPTKGTSHPLEVLAAAMNWLIIVEVGAWLLP